MATTDAPEDTRSLGESLEQFAKDIMREAMAQDEDGSRVAITDKIEALKTVTATYTALKKNPEEPGGDPQGERGGFDFTRGVTPSEEEPSHDTTVAQIRGRRRPG